MTFYEELMGWITLALIIIGGPIATAHYVFGLSLGLSVLFGIVVGAILMTGLILVFSKNF